MVSVFVPAGRVLVVNVPTPETSGMVWAVQPSESLTVRVPVGVTPASEPVVVIVNVTGEP